MFRVSLVFLILLIFSGSCSFNPEKKEERPNIVFIMSDDHAYQAISAYGYELNNTPNIDRIAEEGAIFNRAYVTNSICAPSRAVMLTGKHSFINGKVDNMQPFNWEQDNFAKQLQKAGYQTAMVGKIHLNGLPQGFDYSNVLPGQGHYYNPDFIENGEKKRYQGYCTTITTEIAMDWLKNKREEDKPFLLLYHQKAPHRSWMPEKKYFELFDDKTFAPPANFFDDYKGRKAAAEHEMGIYEHMDLAYDLKMTYTEGDLGGGLRNAADWVLSRMDSAQRAEWDAYYMPIAEDFKNREMTEEELAVWKFNRYIKDYLRCIQSVDDGVGEVLDYLEEAGLDENTIVVYTSDQGFYLGEHGWFDKRFMYEESFRTPLLIKYPRAIEAGSVINELVQNIDFAPTFLDMAGVAIPDDIQGVSMQPLFKGESQNWRDAIYYTYYEYPSEHAVKRHYGVCTERYKLIHFYYDIDEWELYDLQNDPSEMHNVYGDEDYAKVQAMMHQKLEELRTSYGDSDALNEQHLNRYLQKKIK
ncbi:sulfatase [Carboxylicivirga sp. A043]|uniref:sulfatase family protein n=1 Tax=Carboxylicivirga litoralis TaxID=2816963 RepID=UPI0021CB7B4C|nr:sulfatase [Carboxylicivirga sp. A043]MCU4156978.1 sulfatase [Carboxylicivirga sp. A043]